MGKTSFIDLTGQKYAQLTVIKYLGKDKSGKHIWECECDCGTKNVIVSTGSLRSGNTKSCGCWHKKMASLANSMTIEQEEELTGKKFGRLTIKSINGKDKFNHKLCICDCDCGEKNVKVILTQLINNRIISCGCYHKEIVSKLTKKYNKYEIKDDYCIGYLKNNETFIFDIEDLKKVQTIYWRKNKSGYIRSNVNNIDIFLHRLVMDIDDPKILIDHFNHNPSDCRKINLRLVSDLENQMNRSLGKNNTSGYTGVDWCKKSQKWRSRIHYNYQEIILGYFDDFEDAVFARKNAEQEYHGEYSFNNSMEYAQQYEIPNIENVNIQQ